jgi:hydroxymethylbilane synthase
MGRFLKASCNLPIAGFAELVENKLQLNALIADSQAGVYLTASASGALDDYIALGQECAQQLLAQGAASIVAKFAKH